MSYILDALRRADSERERGSVPSIHSPPAPQVADDLKPASGTNARALVWVIVALLLALAGVLAWHLLGNKAPAQAVGEPAPAPDAAETQMPPGGNAPDRMAPQSPSAQEPPHRPAAAQSPRAPQSQQAPTRQAVPPVVVMPTAPSARVPEPAGARQGVQFEQAAPRQPGVPATINAPTQSTPSASPAATASAQAPSSEADTRVRSVNDLPADIQRELPKLVVGGAMYSDIPAKRMLIINSQVFHEGDKLSPDLVLQEIKLKSAVFNYKGYRYGVSY